MGHGQWREKLVTRGELCLSSELEVPGGMLIFRIIAEDAQLGMGPGRRALGADWGNSFIAAGFLQGSLDAMCLEEVKGFHSQESALAEGSPRSPRQRQKWSVAALREVEPRIAHVVLAENREVPEGGRKGRRPE